MTTTADPMPEPALAPPAKPRAAWLALNERQRRYLVAIYHADQGAQAVNQSMRRSWVRTPPASEWRWCDFAIKALATLVGYTSIQRELRDAGEHDPGAGSSLAALRRRGLVKVTQDLIPLPPLGRATRVRVQLTTAGRGAARAGLGERPGRRTKGLLSEWLWRRLVTVAGAEPDGLPSERFGGLAHLYLGTGYKPGKYASRGYIDERNHGSDSSWQCRRMCWHLTAAGREHITEHVETYRELYPDIDITGLPY